jgi:plastocyanin
VPPSPRPTTGRRRRAALAAAAALALLAGACGGDDGAELGTPPAGDVVIVADTASFTPDRVDLSTGRDVTVVLQIDDRDLTHNIRFPEVEGNPKTRLERGPRYQTLEVRFDRPGEYRYVCDLHPTMRGVANATAG